MQETQELWVRSLGQEDPPAEEVATHSRVLAWEIPWTEEPGGLRELDMTERPLLLLLLLSHVSCVRLCATP